MRSNRIRTLGYILAAIGVVFFVVAGIAYTKVQDGYGALDVLSAKQNVLLSYNEDGQLIDRTTEGADAIKLLSPRIGALSSTERISIRTTPWWTRPPSTCTRWPPSGITSSTVRRPSFSLRTRNTTARST